jgi:hypothetical protein
MEINEFRERLIVELFDLLPKDRQLELFCCLNRILNNGADNSEKDLFRRVFHMGAVKVDR